MLHSGDIQVNRIWCGTETGTKLVATHSLSGISIERLIGFETEDKHRREMILEVSHLHATQYPSEDFIMDHIWCGPDKGAALRLRHKPTGISVDCFIGYNPAGSYERELQKELFQRLKWSEISQDKETP